MTDTFHNVRAMDSLRDQIDARIQDLTDDEEIRRLKTQRNELSPISILPPEVLSQIIRHAVVPSMDDRYPWSPLKDAYQEHFALSHVCQSWRKLMLNDCGLWADIRIGLIKHAPMLLERCGMAPISLSLNWTRYNTWTVDELGGALDLITTKCPPLKYLSLDHELVRTRFLPFLWDPAPNLLHCEIAGGAVTNPIRTLFAGSAPRLTALVLEGVEFTWDLPLLYAVPLLQELKITQATNKPTFDQLHAIFSSMDKLQEITLSGANALPNPPHPPDAPTLTFHHVDTLEIQGTAQECASFLTWVEFEMDPSFTVRCTDDLRKDTYRVLQPWLFNLWAFNGRQNLIHTLAIENGFYNCSVHAHARSQRAGSCELYLRWEPDGVASAIPAEFQSWLFQVLPLSNCTELTTNIDLKKDNWWAMCHHMKRLEDLKLMECESISLIWKSLTISDEMDVPLPELKGLEVEGLLTDQELNKFIAMLRCRKRNGLELEYVSVGVANPECLTDVRERGVEVAETFDIHIHTGWDDGDNHYLD